MEKIKRGVGYHKADGWRRTNEYKRMKDLFELYWLDNPTEYYVCVNMLFVDKSGKSRTANVFWENPNTNNVDPIADKARRDYHTRSWEMPAQLGEWTPEEKRLFLSELRTFKRDFYDYITERIQRERRKNEQRLQAKED